MKECIKRAYSNEYADYISTSSVSERILKERYNLECIQSIDNRYVVGYVERKNDNVLINYSSSIGVTIPRLFAKMQDGALESTQVLKVRNNAFLELRGSGVMVGFIDTGIDYLNPLFKNADNTTRIIGMWDQTRSDYQDDEYVPFGRSYLKDEINEALSTDNPLELVDMTDDDGHGTFMAGISCGNEGASNEFSGMAPLSAIGVVKLKDAKPYLKDYYGVSQDIVCYQENDIMMGISYLFGLSNKYDMPLVICLGLGTNLGDHNGNGPLGLYIDYISSNVGKAVCVAAGNEANKSHHYSNIMPLNEQVQDVQLRVSDKTKGFTVQLWTQTPNSLAVGFSSPTGERYDKIPARLGESRQIRFIIGNSTIDVDYSLLQQDIGDELIEMRFRNPTSGIWTIHVYNEGVVDGGYDMWLPCEGLIEEDTYFLIPDPDITITEPANSRLSITCAGYDHKTDSIYIGSGRGYTRLGVVAPDITAPAVNIYGPIVDGRYVQKTGTSISAAFCSGAAALVEEWAFIRGNDLRMNGNVLRKYMIRGANRSSIRQYPNNEWGYGILDVYGIFQSFFR